MELGSGVDDYESLISTTDADLLKRSWRNEKASPEILQFQSSLVQRSREQIELMEETVEELVKNDEDPLTVSLYQMDIDRTLFLLRSYLRTRLQKIEKFMFHIQKTSDLWSRLSRQEQKFAKRSIEDMKQHLEQSVLSKFPDRYKSHLKQSVISEEDDMEIEYAEESAKRRVFNCFLSLNHLWYDSGEENPLDMYAGDIYALRYKSIKPLIESGQLDLIEKFMFHIQKASDLWSRLSRQEQKFAKRSIEDMKQHLERSVLSKLPDQYNSHLKQSVISEEDDMVEKKTHWDMYAGDIYALRYKSIKPLIESGQLDLV
ncbi:hypothetical protein E3N88_11087 [Mikania micrantha]|uniref:DNA replication complex GINS protein SLD5 n=1 Tax=Mikania micrantha TaxID=192012 RepID=A0A5N6PFC3_9ASTR|nr:hypothetical protein E3N88_11087 [Mikania micrantha]